jgi:hypothetical protein
MPTTTALVMVNRMNSLLRKGGPSSLSSVTTDPGAVYLVLLNAAKNEIFTFDWDSDKRHDGELVTVARRSYTGTFTATNASTTVTNVAQNHYASFYGSFRSRLVLTEDATAGGTSYAITTATHPAADDVYTLETAFHGTGGSGLNGFVYVVDYQLPATVKDVLSVRHEEDEVKLGFVDRTHTFDRLEPAAHDVQSDSPEIVYVGGTVEATVTSGTPTNALGLMVWPVPTAAYLLSYSYRYLHPQLAATTDVLDAPEALVDLVVDRAVAKAYRSAVANDPEMADRIDVDVARRIALLQKVNSPAPARRSVLKSHDHVGGATQFGSRPANPRTFYTP